MPKIREGIDLILASGSPRRRDLLRDAGIEFRVEVRPVDEQPLTGETPQQLVERLALAKARVVSALFPTAWVLSADTTVALHGRILGKPEDALDALHILTLLQGNRHEVWTGFALLHGSPAQERIDSNCTHVEMLPQGKHELEAYIATGEPMDKAGAYAIQGHGAHLISRIDGSYTNVVGLDIAAVVDMLRRCGVVG